MAVTLFGRSAKAEHNGRMKVVGNVAEVWWPAMFYECTDLELSYRP